VSIKLISISERMREGRHDMYYLYLWQTMMLKPLKYPEVQEAVKIIREGEHNYKYVEKKTGVDWRIVGVIHYMEASCNFRRQLFNGEDWRERTKLHPKGLGPWFTWESAAVDVFKDSAYPNYPDIPETLRLLESHNGRGYVYRNLNSPYLWSYSNHYDKGKYIADGKFDGEAVSKQVGAAVLLKMLEYADPIQLEFEYED